MAYRFLVKDVSPQRLIVRRARASRFDWGATLDGLLTAVWDYLNRQESVTVGPAMARFHEIDATTIEIEAGFPVVEPISGRGDIQVTELPACRAATTLLEGPYERLKEAHAALEEWMAQQGFQPAGPPWAIFWVTPDDVELPAEFRSEIVWPLGAAAGDLFTKSVSAQ